MQPSNEIFSMFNSSWKNLVHALCFDNDARHSVKVSDRGFLRSAKYHVIFGMHGKSYPLSGSTFAT